MIKNFDFPLLTLDDKPMESEGVISTARMVLMNACMATFPDEQNVSGEEKLSRYELGMKIKKGGDIELTPEEIVTLKKLVGKGWAPLIVGQIFTALNS